MDNLHFSSEFCSGLSWVGANSHLENCRHSMRNVQRCSAPAEGMEVLADQADQADDNGTENGTIPSLNFTSCGLGQQGDDSASDSGLS